MYPIATIPDVKLMLLVWIAVLVVGIVTMWLLLFLDSRHIASGLMTRIYKAWSRPGHPLYYLLPKAERDDPAKKLVCGRRVYIWNIWLETAFLVACVILWLVL